MPYFQVTLNQGRTDTVTAEFFSFQDCKTFWNSVSTANITSIKEIVYSKELNIGTALTSFTPSNNNTYLNIMVRNSNGENGVINIQHPIKNLSKEQIIKSVKKNLLLNDKPITNILNIMVKQ
jgi:hypothetical protein